MTELKKDANWFLGHGEPDEGFPQLPIGRYQGRVVSSGKIRQGNKGEMAIFVAKVDDDWEAEPGKKHGFFYNLANEYGAPIFRGDMIKCEFADPKSLKAAAKCMEQIGGVQILWEVRKGKDEYVNTRILERLDGTGRAAETLAEASEEGSNDSKPAHTAREIRNMSEATITSYGANHGLDVNESPYDEMSWEEFAEEVVKKVGAV